LFHEENALPPHVHPSTRRSQVPDHPLLKPILLGLFAILLVFSLSNGVGAQTATYHLHKEASSTSGLDQLKTAGPDATTVALTSVDLKSQATGEYIVKAFDTQAGVPNVSGVIPAASTVTFTLWLKKTANVGTMFPRAKLNLNSAAGTSLCTSTGSTALTTTLTKYTLTCTTSANITVATGDRFYLWVGINLTAGNSSTTFQGSLNIEGTLNGNYDSQIIAPLPITPPSISGLSATSGPVGTSITVSGANFGATQGTSTLTFNGTAATPTSWSTGSIVAPVPAGATTGPVVVSVKGVPSNGVTFTVKPKINSLSPTSGPVGTSVTINGTTFGATQGSSTVTFNGTTAAPTSWSASSIAVPVPANATTGNVIVTVSGQASNGVAFTVTPKITSLSPPSGAVATSVTITGTTFGATQGTSTVTFNGTTATPTSWGSTSIAAPVPAAATTGPVVVTVSGQASNGSTFTVTPKINTLSPTSGPVGTSVTISGTTFGATQGTSTVAFNGTSATPTSWSATSIAVPVPAGATTGPVVVTVSGQASNGVSFTVTPKINSLAPTSGGVGDSVTISGTTFGSTQGTSTVTFNGTSATPTAWNASSITVPVPSGATTGPVVVTVSGQASNGVTFTVNNPIPVINNLSITSGPVSTPLTITGSNFGSTQGTSSVRFNGTTASPTSWSATSISVSVPAGATTGLVIVTVNGQASNGVTFSVTPKIDSLSPSSGPVGVSVTISGTTFGATQGPGTVAFNGTTASATTWSDTSITAAVPAGSSSGPVVVTAGGFSSNGVNFSLAPSLTNLSPTSGQVGATVTLSGASFGGTQGSSVVTFNGTVATPISWSDTAIVTSVPSGASTGSVIVTVGGIASNGLTFSVTTTGTVAGTISRASDSSPISGAFVELLQSGVLKASANSNATGSYSISGLTAGNYDVRVSAYGFNTAFQLGNSVSGGGTTTVNVSLVAAVPGTLAGKITQADGLTPIVGASVKAYQNTAIVGTVTTNGTGDYTFNEIFPGTYTVEASATSYVTRSQAGVTITSSNTTTANISLNAVSGSNNITYKYDQLGRLIAVVDPNGDAATYTYDAVGNLLSISRQSSTRLTILSVTPNAGPVGMTVIINGTGFHETATENSVSFNGTAATISSSTSTQIITTVPLGATTGLITVTTPEDSVSSASPFTVGSSAAPTIAGFTPVIGAAGTGVTIVGTNFDPLLSNNTVSFGASNATVTAATGTNIITTVPAGGSGRITVTTPSGTAVSTNDFINAPAPYSGADVDYTSRMNFGDTRAVTINARYRVAMILFDGTAGQRISLNITNVTFNQGRVTIYSPSGAFSGSKDVTNAGGLFVTTLQANGTYLILVDPDNDNSGSATLTLNSVPPDVNDSISIDGPTMSETITAPGQNVRLSFTGNAGQKIVLNLSSITVPSGLVYIYNPDSSILASAAFTTSGGFIDIQTLATTGTYTIVVVPDGVGMGNVTVSLSTAPSDATGTMVVGGASVPVNLNTSGQNARITFSGNAAQRVTLNITGVTIPWTDVTILNPDSSTLTQTAVNQNGGIIDIQTLTTSGTYTVVIDPRGAATGTLNLNATTSAADGHLIFNGITGRHLYLKISNVSGAETLTLTDPNSVTLDTIGVNFGAGYINRTLLATGSYNAAVTPQNNFILTVSDGQPNEFVGVLSPGNTTFVNASSANVNTWLSFTGTAGQKMSLNVSNSTITVASISVYSPDGTLLVAPTNFFTGGPTFIDAFTLPLTGSYMVLIDPAGTFAGSVNVKLYDATDLVRQILPGGSSVSVPPGYPIQGGFGQASHPGTNALVTFNGFAGERISLSMNVTDQFGSANISILRPDGSILVNPQLLGYQTSRTGFVDTLILPVAGTYTILVDPPASNAAIAVLNLYDVPADVTGAVSVNGPAVPVTTSIPGQDGLITFNAVAGQHLSLSVTNAASVTTLTIKKPDGTTLISNSAGMGDSLIDIPLIPTSGTYTILVNTQSNPGSMTLALAQIVDVTGTITVGGAAVPINISSVNQNAQLTFAGAAGDHLSLNLSNVTINQSMVSIYKPDGTVLTSNTSVGTSGATIDVPAVPVSGTYTILVDPQSSNTGNMTLSLSRITDVTGTITIGGSAVPITIATAGQNARLTFSATAAQHLKLQMSSVTITASNVSVLQADGSNLTSPLFVSTGGGTLEIPAIPTTGTYSILVDPLDANTGNMTLTLTQVTDITNTITIGGSPVTVTTANGQNAKVSFSGTAGQKVSLNLTAVSISQSSVSIYKPDWTLLSSPLTVGTNGGFLDSQTLTTTGTYNILVDPQGSATGHMTLTLYDSSDITGAITPGGSAVNVTVSRPGQNANLTFTGVAGQRITVWFTANTVSASTVSVVSPSGATLQTSFVSNGSSSLPTVTLPANGTYTLSINPDLANTGSLTVQIGNP
jgi:YD repeat-containing protein